MMLRKLVGPAVALAMLIAFGVSSSSASAASIRTTGTEAKVSANELPKLVSAATLAMPELLMCEGFEPVDPWGNIYHPNGNPFDPWLEEAQWLEYEYFWAWANSGGA